MSWRQKVHHDVKKYVKYAMILKVCRDIKK